MVAYCSVTLILRKEYFKIVVGNFHILMTAESV